MYVMGPKKKLINLMSLKSHFLIIFFNVSLISQSNQNPPFKVILIK